MDWSFPIKEKRPLKQISGVTKPEKKLLGIQREACGHQVARGNTGKRTKNPEGRGKEGKWEKQQNRHSSRE